MVRPVPRVPAPMVEEAEEVKPRRMGLLLKTATPVPVSSVRVLERTDETPLEMRFLEESVSTKREAVRPETLALVEKRLVENKSVEVPAVEVNF